VRNNSATTVGGIWVQSGGLTVLGTLFCGNGVNINGTWTNLGGNQLNGQCAPFCAGDSNGDTYIDARDVAELLSDWGACTATPCYSDFNSDGVVDARDLAYVLSSWGRCQGW
ncbi:MAG: dockerin type I domain-containing protein, partial [Planctomycetota bacterium]